MDPDRRARRRDEARRGAAGRPRLQRRAERGGGGEEVRAHLLLRLQRLWPAVLELEDCLELQLEFANRDSRELGTRDEDRPGYADTLHLFKEHGYPGVGLGVLDIHSDFVEPAELVRDRILFAVSVLDDPGRIQVNPGLRPAHAELGRRLREAGEHGRGRPARRGRSEQSLRPPRRGAEGPLFGRKSAGTPLRQEPPLQPGGRGGVPDRRAESYELVSRIDEILSEVEDEEEHEGRVKPELLQSVVEVATNVAALRRRGDGGPDGASAPVCARRPPPATRSSFRRARTRSPSTSTRR